MNDSSFNSAGTAAPRVATESPSYGLARTFAWLAVLTLARIVYLYVHPFDLHGDEAQYWVWAQDLAFGYYSKPPVVAWLIAASTAVCGDGEACIRMTTPLAHMATALAIYGIGHRLYDTRIGFWSALVYATLPGVSVSAFVISTDVPLLFFWALALYALVTAVQHNSWRRWLLLGIAIGLGLLSKYSMLFFVLSAAIYGALEWRALKATMPGLVPRALVALAAAALIYLPNLLWNMANGFVSYGHTGDNINLSGPLFRPEKMAEFVGSQFGVFGPVLFGLLLVVLWRKRAWMADRRTRLLICFTLPTLAVIVAQSFLSRAHPNWAATAYVAASVLVTAWVFQNLSATASVWRGKALLITGSVVVHAGLAVLAFVYLAASYGRPDALPMKADPFQRVRGWHELGASIELARREFGAQPLLVDDRMLLAEVLYYGRPWSAGALKWRPAGVNDHFDLTRPLVAPAPARLMLVTERTDASAITGRFAKADIIAEIRTPIGVERERVVRLYALEGFLGYAARP